MVNNPTYSTDLARKAQKQFDIEIKGDLPDFHPKGSRQYWIDNLHMIIDMNWWRLREAIVKRDDFICQDCGRKVNPPEQNQGNNDFEIHHIIPKSVGGSDHPLNLKTLCVHCHRKQTNYLLGNKSAYHPNQRSLEMKKNNRRQKPPILTKWHERLNCRVCQGRSTIPQEKKHALELGKFRGIYNPDFRSTIGLCSKHKELVKNAK